MAGTACLPLHFTADIGTVLVVPSLFDEQRSRARGLQMPGGTSLDSNNEYAYSFSKCDFYVEIYKPRVECRISRSCEPTGC
jgi:hypothetical protein